tara:strand:- start:901 stop:1413 length:513 start_codon:yes stop_codon:yes gene_type:complete
MTSILKVSEIQDPTNSNTALTIDANGYVSGKTISPAFVCRSSVATTLTNNVFTSLTWAEELDTHNAVSSGVFTVPSGQSGIYHFSTGVTVNGIGAGTSIITTLFINGSNSNEHEVYNPTAITNQAVRAVNVATLSAGDTVEFKVSQFSGGDLDTGFVQDRKAFFCGFRLG